MSAKKSIDWELIEREYRAGIKTLRQMAEEHGVSHVTIAQRAKRYSWERDLQEKIQQAAKNKTTRAEATKRTNKELKTDAQVVEAYADVVAHVDQIQREDVGLAVTNTRNQLQELVLLGDPEFKERLVWLGELMYDPQFDKNGNEKPDKANELYNYIISLAGRVKMAKEIAATHGVYIPLQRKIFGLDQEKQTTTDVDLLLKRINEEIQE